MNQENHIKYPVGIQSFEKLRESGYLYVDKTPLIHSLINEGGCIFLARPRRFGKSLLLSTIEAYYQGRRDLFKGLALDKLAADWEEHPVLRLDLNNGQYGAPGDLLDILDFNLRAWEEKYIGSLDAIDKELPVSLRFSSIIKAAYEATGKKVVVLVDEYDKPLLSTINNPELADSYRSQLKAFYSNLKTMDQYIEFGMLTGVARFSKVSIFSDLNNLRDISFENKYSSICGITNGELDSYFQDGMHALAQAGGLNCSEVREELRKRYDGYHFSKESEDIYNPFSLVNVFAKCSFGSYWFDSGTPTYLVNLIQKEDWHVKDLAPVEISETQLENAGILAADPIPAFYQSGYLTIKDFDSKFRSYILDYPNEEVKEGFFSFLVPAYLTASARASAFSIKRFITSVEWGDPEEFMALLEGMLSGVPYSEKGSAEAHFQNAIYILFTLMGFYANVEQRTSNGRIDLVVVTGEYVYIFEFKIDSSAEVAMKQIDDKRYWASYVASGKKLFLIGADFSTATRSISEYLIREV
ncbi:MAG: ATP-binding protein [Muribaculaceae bacterium]|nr:ATP-binding protein [Muribaculaceae bacterium]